MDDDAHKSQVHVAGGWSSLGPTALKRPWAKPLPLNLRYAAQLELSYMNHLTEAGGWSALLPVVPTEDIVEVAGSATC